MSGRSISSAVLAQLGLNDPSMKLILVEFDVMLLLGDFVSLGTRPFHFKTSVYSQAIPACRHWPQAGFASSHFWRRLLQRAQPWWERLIFVLMCTSSVCNVCRVYCGVDSRERVSNIPGRSYRGELPFTVSPASALRTKKLGRRPSRIGDRSSLRLREDGTICNV